jgi:arylsulfatase A-like enzyme
VAAAGVAAASSPPARPAQAGAAARNPRPVNLLMLTTDQHRADCVGCYGNSVIHTPALDRLAREGVRFSGHYVQAPQCVPSRGSLHTGRYPHVHRAVTNRFRLPGRERTLAAVLNERGYLTASIGEKPFAPNNSTGGFRRIYGGPEHDALLRKAGWPGEKLRDYSEGLKRPFQAYPAPWGEELDESSVFASLAVDFLRQNRAQPFFLHVNFRRPHHPFDPPRPYDRMYEGVAFPPSHRRENEMAKKPPEQRRALESSVGFDLRTMTAEDLRRVTSYYYGSITLTDKCVGRVLDEVDTLGLAGNTLLVFNSDHGEMLGDHGLLFKGSYMYDELLRTPLIMRLPGRLPAGRVLDTMVQEIDQMPTLLQLLGAPVPEGVQGRSLLPLIEQRSGLQWNETVFAEFPNIKAVHTRDWKLVYYPGKPYGELHDLRKDPHELENLWDEPSRGGARQEMMARLADWLISSQDPLPPPIEAPEVR